MTVEATDLDGLRARLDQSTEVRGTIADAGQSKAGNVLYLNFSRRPHEALALVFFVKANRGDAGTERREQARR